MGDGPVCLGIEIGGTKLQVCAGTAEGKLIERFRLTVDPARGGAGIRQQLEGLLPKVIARFHPVSAGVGFGGPVDWRTGQICCSHQIEGWGEFPFGSWLGSLTGLPVAIDNDANVAALGEGLTGAGAWKNPVFYVTLGSGVGGGLVVDGKIYHGACPGESEIGHVRLDKSGAIVEERCSGWAIDKRVRAAARSAPNSVLGRAIAGVDGHESKCLSPALQAGDPLAADILRELSEDLAFALSHVAHLFHPEMIVLGGGLSLIGEPLRATVAEFLPRFVMKAFAPSPRVALAAHGEDAVPIGALLLAKEIRRNHRR